MGKNSSSYESANKRTQKQSIHSAWYIVGVLLLLLTPLLAYAVAELIFQKPDLIPPITQPLYNTFSKATDLYAVPGQALYFGDKFFYIKLLITLCLTMVSFALFAMVTFIINGAMGGTRYGPYDMPPISRPKGGAARKAR